MHDHCSRQFGFIFAFFLSFGLSVLPVCVLIFSFYPLLTLPAPLSVSVLFIHVALVALRSPGAL